MFPGDVVVGDAEGVVIIPAALADDVATEAAEMTEFENFVSMRVHEGQSIIGLYPPTDPATRVAFEAWRNEKRN